MEVDNKYDQSFRMSEIGIKKCNQYEPDKTEAHLEAEERFKMWERENLEKLADRFGGGGGWI